MCLQELRSREEEINEAAIQQKIQEEFLRRREEELAQREIELVERELNIMILQQISSKPTPKKRKGKFKKSHLKLLKSGGHKISQPSGKTENCEECSKMFFPTAVCISCMLFILLVFIYVFTKPGFVLLYAYLVDFRHNITVTQEQPFYLEKHLRRLPSSPDSPPASPSFPPRLRAIACMCANIPIIWPHNKIRIMF